MPCSATSPRRANAVVSFASSAAMGLVNSAMARDAVLEQTLAYAHDLAVNCSPASMATMKRQVYADLERAVPDALAEADRLMLQSFAAPDFAEGVTSFLERREPHFAALSG